MNWINATSSYLTFLKAAGYAPTTLRTYAAYINLMRRIAPAPALVTSNALIKWIAQNDWSREGKKSARTVAKGFFKFLEESEIIAVNPAEKLPPIKPLQALPRPASDKDIQEAINRADEQTAIMIKFAAFAGLRCAEIAQIHANDWDGYTLTVHGKGSKDRSLPISHPSIKLAINKLDGFLFPSTTKAHLTPGTVSVKISRAIPPGVTAHMLRHRFATVAYRNTGDLIALSACLGHSKPETTKRYVEIDGKAKAGIMAAAMACG